MISDDAEIAVEQERELKQPTLRVSGLSVTYGARRGSVKALRSVSFEVYPGQALALIGESGCGKTTLGLALVRLLPSNAQVTAGQVRYQRQGSTIDVLALKPEELRRFRWRECAMIFQSALNALNPVLRVRDQVLDTARAHGMRDRRQVEQRMRELFRLVQLDPQRVMRAYPHQLSGGMRQRALLALGLLLNPQLVILDEPTTALDVLTQRSVIEVLRTLRAQHDFALIFISHDLSLAAELADQVATMYAGQIVELASVWDTYYRPRHPYTLSLIRAVPTIAGEQRELVSIPGSPPDLISPPPGCAFEPRCPFASERCRAEPPPLREISPAHQVACWHWEQVARSNEARQLADREVVDGPVA